jgi:hypothetical protein
LGCYPGLAGLCYLTKADSASNPDAPFFRQQIIGRVSGIEVCSRLFAVSLTDRFRSCGFFIYFAMRRLCRKRR